MRIGIDLLVAFSLWLLPARNINELLFRFDLADAIRTVTDDEHEQRVLMKIARFESGFAPRLAAPTCRCLKTECDDGRARGTWQIIPREGDKLCVSLVDDARVALFRVRESYNVCKMHGLPREERLAVYARGSCASVEGRALSRIRWAE